VRSALLAGVLLFCWYPSAASPMTLAYYEFGWLYHAGRGLDKDVAEEVARRVGKVLETKTLARARIWKDLKDGALDATTSGVETAERTEYAWFVPYMAFRNYAIVPQALAVKVPTFDRFLADETLIFGAVTSFRYGAVLDSWLQQLRSKGRLEESPDFDVLFRKLKEGRVQGLFATPTVYTLYMDTAASAGAFQVYDWVPQEKALTAGFALSRKTVSEAEFHRWKSAVRSMRDDGTLKTIFLRYMSPADAARTLEF